MNSEINNQLDNEEAVRTAQKSFHSRTVSRRKLLASLGITGAAAMLSGAILPVNSVRASVAHSVYGGGGPHSADNLTYKYETSLQEHSVGDRLRERVSVKDFGAVGDGVADDTACINAAIQNVSASGGGTLYVPRGTYNIAAAKTSNTAPGGVIMKSGVHLQFDSGAVFKAIPTGSMYYSIVSIIDCERVRISGAQLVGERYEHLDTQGEWGHGFLVMNSSQLTIVDTQIRDCWGDGLYIRSATKTTLVRIVSDNNRRQGMSLISCTDFRADHCIFQNTNGTDPQSGVDLEPNQATEEVRNVSFNACQFINNQGRGFVVGIRRGATCENILLSDSVITGNRYESFRIAGRNNSIIRSITLTNVILDDFDIGLANEAAITNVALDRIECKSMVFRSVAHLLVTRTVLHSDTPSEVRSLEFNNVSDAVVRDAWILDSSSSGIGLVSGYNERITLDRVTIRNAAGHGIQANSTSAKQITIVNSEIKDSASSGIEGVSVDWIVSRNFLRNNRNLGIRLASTADHSIISENHCSGNASGDIVNDGAATNLIVNNMLV